MNGLREWLRHRFGDEKVNVVGHYNVSEDLEVVLASCPFKRVLEQIARFGGVEIGKVLVSTEVDRVVMA